jgi:hypothetical protein
MAPIGFQAGQKCSDVSVPQAKAPPRGGRGMSLPNGHPIGAPNRIARQPPFQVGFNLRPLR